MSQAAKADDQEVQELRARLQALPLDRRVRVLAGVLTPGLRLAVLAEEVGARMPTLTENEETGLEREIDEAVLEIRRSRGRAR